MLNKYYQKGKKGCEKKRLMKGIKTFLRHQKKKVAI